MGLEWVFLFLFRAGNKESNDADNKNPNRIKEMKNQIQRNQSIKTRLMDG